MNSIAIFVSVCALFYLASGDNTSDQSSCFSKYVAKYQCIEGVRNKSADWKNLADKRKQIATDCVAKNKKWEKCVSKWEEMKSCWQKAKSDANVLAAEKYLATIFDSCINEYPASPFAAISPHKRMRRPPHHKGEHHQHHHRRMEEERSEEKKSRSSENKSRKSGSSEDRSDKRSKSNEMGPKPHNDEMFPHNEEKFDKKPMGMEMLQGENGNIFDRVKRMAEGPKEHFDHEDFGFERRRHHGKHHRKSPCMGLMKCIWEGEKALIKTDKSLVKSADGVVQAKLKCKTDNYVGYACLPDHFHFERCTFAPMKSLEMEFGRAMHTCMKSDNHSGESGENSTSPSSGDDHNLAMLWA